MEIKTHPEGVLIEVRVRPSSGRFLFIRKGDSLTLEVTSPPHGGRANTEIVKALRKLTGHDVEILKGLRSRNKLILIRGAKPDEIERLL